MKKLMLFLGKIFFIILFAVTTTHSQMLATITEDVTTEFGTYHPIPVDFTAQVPAFTFKPDFGDVNNFNQVSWNFNGMDSALLRANHFTVKKSQYKQLFDVYNYCTWNGTPIFVTTDAVLHTYHVLFDRILAEIEMKKFVAELNALTENLIIETENVYSQSVKADAKEAARRNLAFLYVAKKLLNGTNVAVPATVAALVDSELVLIDKHEGYSISPIFGYFSELDYSQLQPRGHYTKTDTLKAYFKAMMWYGWTIFTMEPHLFDDLSYHHTLQALMLVQMLYRLQADNQPLLEKWQFIYDPTVFFVGKTDDPTILDYKLIADKIYGINFSSLSLDSLANKNLLAAFMTEAQQLPEPKIPNWIYGTFTTYKGFRFMGQRFIPDSYMFAHLIDPYVWGRYFPKGLDVMAILGSKRAFAILDSLYKETSYQNYTQQINGFKTEFVNLTPAAWAQNLYWNWLYSLMPLLYEKGAGYPFFMQTLAWANKELLTALASWAELRHDTILYAKQSTTPCGIAPGPPRNYVEPNPHLYARLASLAKYTRDGLQSRNLLFPEFKEKLNLFENLLLFLKRIAIKELENTPLTDQEYEDIYCFGKVMQKLVSYYPDPQNPWKSDTDDMAVVADVHTDSNSDKCLEEGVGYPLEIFVIVNEGGTIRITKGAIFSYYEFIQPIAGRLSDEVWRRMLVDDKPPRMPDWISNFMDLGQTQPPWWEDSPDNLFQKEFSSVQNAEPKLLPKTIRLLQNYPNPFNEQTMIKFQLPKSANVKIEIFNLLGQKIRTLLYEPRVAGFHIIKWDGKDDLNRSVSSGVYFVSIEVEQFRQVNKLVLLR